MSRLSYYTADPVNADHASQLAADVALDAEIYEPRELDRPVQAEVLVFDLDSLAHGRAERSGLIGRIVERSGLVPTAVHSYNLEPSEVKRLRAAGVPVFRTLCQDMLTQLMAEPSPEADQNPAPPVRHCDVSLSGVGPSPVLLPLPDAEPTPPAASA
jgi:hypothetical protein